MLVNGSRVVGPGTVRPGGALTVTNSKISDGITADNPSFFDLCGSDVTGSPSGSQALTLTNATVPVRIGDAAAGCAGNRFAGGVTVTGNLAVTFADNTTSGQVQIDTNGPGAVVVKSNTLYGTLTCTVNNPPPTNAGSPNTAATKLGQCAAL